MRNLGLMSLIFAATMAAATPFSLAQNANPPASTLEQSAEAPHSSGGGTKDQNAALRASEAADDQPLMATGVDLKGPPTKFPAALTPE